MFRYTYAIFRKNKMPVLKTNCHWKMVHMYRMKHVGYVLLIFELIKIVHFVGVI